MIFILPVKKHIANDSIIETLRRLCVIVKVHRNKIIHLDTTTWH